MPRISDSTKEQLREYQNKSRESMRANNIPRYRKALELWEKSHDINKITSHFRVKKNNAYKMVRKGRDLQDDV